MEEKMKRILILVILLLLPVYVFGQTETGAGVSQDLGPTIVGGTAKVAQSGAQFLQIGVSARGTAMGEAFLAVADDASAAYYSPGALARINRKQMMVTQTSLPAQVKHFFGAFILPMEENIGTFAVHTILLTTGEMPVTKAFIGPTGESFSCSEMAVGLSYSRNLTDKFSVGGTIKYIQQNLAGFTSKGVAADFGTFYLTGFRDLQFGMAITNFGPNLNFGDSKDIGYNSIDYPLPMNFSFGIAMSIIDKENHNLRAAFETGQPNDNLRREALGVEYTFMDMLMLRGGYKFEYDGEDFSLGAGMKAPIAGFDGLFDVSYARSEYMNDFIRFSLGVAF